MAPPSTTGSSAKPDMALIGELLENISRNPPALVARKLLVEHYISVGWLDAALEHADDLSRLSPADQEVSQFLQVLRKKPDPPAAVVDWSKPVATMAKAATEIREWDTRTSRYKKKDVQDITTNKFHIPTIETSSNVAIARKNLVEGYASLKTAARSVVCDLLRLQVLQKKVDLPHSGSTSRILAIAEGRREPTDHGVGAPRGVRAVARTIRANSEDAVDLIITDFENFLYWTQEPCRRPSSATADTIRSALLMRKTALEFVLPEGIRLQCEVALMHIEHENICLDRNYVNTETMLMEKVSDIPRCRFYVTEDNYAWDLQELVDAITANSGIFRNPLSRDMFTPKDVKGILIHPLGKSLSALAVEQHDMAKGVRAATIAQMEKLSKVLLEDQSSDTIPSRKAVDEFLAYVATLPEPEQKVIDSLKCPAKDSHTGQAYDFTIGESVQDAKGNRVCFHKTGDFIKQAAAHLSNTQGFRKDKSTDRGIHVRDTRP
ncbi:hypothetical protein ACN47E_004780 [Coniothyrium glycines]